MIDSDRDERGLVVQALRGIGIVSAAAIAAVLAGLVLAVIVAWIF